MVGICSPGSLAIFTAIRRATQHQEPLSGEASPPRPLRPRIGDREALGLLLPLVALNAQIVEHKRQHSEALLEPLCPVLRHHQRSRYAGGRAVAVCTVALCGCIDAVQLGWLDPPLPKRVLGARYTASFDGSQYGALVDAACRCGLAQAVAHGGAPRRVAVQGQRCAALVKSALRTIYVYPLCARSTVTATRP